MNLDTIALLHRDRQFGMSNGGWAYDAYPQLPTLDAGRSITIAAIEGPAVITQIHTTQHLMTQDGKWIPEDDRDVCRGVVLEIYFNDISTPAVCVPLADFFADGCNGRGANFGSYFVEKSPGAYNCYIPMPFAQSARVILRNDTALDLMNYSFVEYERLPRWDDSLGYFHATWRRAAFQLHGQTVEPIFHVDGYGHLLGRAWSFATDEALFDDYTFVMEGNNEVRIDGDAQPTVDYLGTEDSFGFSWGFRATYAGPFGGMNYIHNSQPALLSIYRFRKNNLIRFQNSLDWRINWSHEWTRFTDFQRRLAERHAVGGGWVDYATTFYWYQEHVGYSHAHMPELQLRTRTLLHPNVT